MGKGKILFFFVLILSYLIGLGIVLVNKPKEEKIEEIPQNLETAQALSPMTSSYNPPIFSLKGILVPVANNVEKLSRFSQDWEKIASPTSVLNDEKVLTDNKGQANVIFTNQLLLTINPNSEVYFASLLSDSFLIEQVRGSAVYIIDKPISIKSIDTLTVMQSGKIILEIDQVSNFITINIASGSGKFSFIDNDNQTRVYKIEKGNKVTYNPENTSIIIKN